MLDAVLAAFAGKGCLAAKPVKAIDTLLKVVDDNPHGLFWG